MSSADWRARLDLAAVEVLLCDADGNLFPSEEPAFEASAVVTNRFMAAIGSDRRFEPEALRLATTGKNFRTTAVDLAVDAGVRLEAAIAGRHPGAAATGAAERVLTADELEVWVATERREVTAHLRRTLRPDPGVRDPLARLHGRVGLAAVSSSALDRLAGCFEATGLDPLIPAPRRFSAEDSLPVPTSKPDPAVYLLAGEVLGVAGAAGLAVEDSVPGALSAVAAGFPTLGNVQFVPPAERARRTAELLEAGVAGVLESWAELERALEAAPERAR
jgi:beta-phosphoglucomutase-like phosphatase (HAD superfamily)